jgi:hypothetical protein
MAYLFLSLMANGLRFTCAAQRSGAASGESACWAALFSLLLEINLP